jgi:hypothetical protein
MRFERAFQNLDKVRGPLFGQFFQVGRRASARVARVGGSCKWLIVALAMRLGAAPAPGRSRARANGSRVLLHSAETKSTKARGSRSILLVA